MNKEKLIESVKRGEGCRLRAYKDSVGVLTIGWGHNLENLKISQTQADEWREEDWIKISFVSPAICKLRAYKGYNGCWMIGWDHNLETLRITQSLADQWLLDDIHSAMISVAMFPEWQFLDTDARQNAFTEMLFNLGPTRLSFFKNMLTAIRAQDWKTVAKEALDSKWATQVGQRALRLIAMLQTGQFQE